MLALDFGNLELVRMDTTSSLKNLIVHLHEKAGRKSSIELAIISTDEKTGYQRLDDDEIED